MIEKRQEGRAEAGGFPTEVPSEQACLSRVFECAKEGLCFIDNEHNIVRVNPMLEGWYPDYVPLVGKKCHRVLHGSFETCPECPLLQSADSGGAVSFVFPRQDCTGRTTGWLESFAFPCENPKTGEADGIVAFIRDVTARREMEESLRDLRRAVEQSPSSVVITDTSGEFVYVNPRFTELTGYTPQDVKGKTPRILKSGRVPVELYEELWSTITAGGVWAGEFCNRKKNGDLYWESAAISPVRNPDGLVTHYVATLEDITEKREAEKELAESHQFLKTVIDGVAGPILVIGTDYEVKMMNRTAYELSFGNTESDPSQSPLLCCQVLHHQDEPCRGEREPCPLKEVLEKNEPVIVTHEHFRPDGEKRLIEILASPLEDTDGNVIGIIESSRDVTELRKATIEQQRLETQVRHTQKLESLGILAGGIAHDFNNLLTAVLGHAELALDELPVGSQSRERVSEIKAAAKRAAELTNQMLAYSGKGQFVVEMIDLNEHVKGICHLLEASISKKAILVYDLAKSIPRIEGDPSQISQILMNLITNAADAIGDENGTITIRTDMIEADREYLESTYVGTDLPEGHYVRLEVSDTGCGMDEVTRTHMFDPFFTTKFAGRGLGLAATLGIVRGHRGSIAVYSEIGQGTMFKVILPVSRKTPASETVSGSERDALAQWKAEGLVLVIDDEEMVCDVAKRMLEKQGFTVLVAGDGRQGVELFQKHADETVAVLLDMTMPHMDGKQAFREIRAIRPDAKVILSSGFNEEDAIVRFGNGGLAGFIQKPFPMKKLIKVFHDLLVT